MGYIVGLPFLRMQGKGNAACGFVENGNLLFKNRAHGLQMVQFESPKVIHPLESFQETESWMLFRPSNF